MLEVCGRPFISHQLEQLASQGITNVVLCIGHLGEQIQQFVADGSQWGLRVSYCDEGSNLLGTAGALRLAHTNGRLASRFLVTYGDSFLPIHFPDVFDAFVRSGQPALMSVFKNEHRWDSSNVSFDGTRIVLYDKTRKTSEHPMDYIDYGLSAMSKQTVSAEIPTEGKADLADLFHRLSLKGALAGFEVTRRFYEIGSASGLEELRTLLSKSQLTSKNALSQGEVTK